MNGPPRRLADSHTIHLADLHTRQDYAARPLILEVEYQSTGRPGENRNAVVLNSVHLKNHGAGTPATEGLRTLNRVSSSPCHRRRALFQRARPQAKASLSFSSAVC